MKFILLLVYVWEVLSLRKQRMKEGVSFLQIWSDMISENQVQSRLKMLSKKRRITKDGRKCASQFVQNGKIYKDCATVVAPDGKNSKQEWCYVDPNEGGSPNWDYCAPILDYDSVREKTKEMYDQFIPMIRKATELVQMQQQPTSKCSSDHLEIMKQQVILDKETSLLEKQMESLAKIMTQLQKMKAQWEEWEIEIGKQVAKIKELEAAEPEVQTADCEGLLGYEKENKGDGMVGFYYNNEDFIGNPLVKEDEELDFDWQGQAPMEKIYPDNFSIKWTTYLKIPVTGKYIFKVISDDGASMYLNDKLIVSHFMGSTDGPREEVKEDNSKSHLYDNINNYELGQAVMSARKSFSYSEEVSVTSDTKYKLNVLYFHSIHNKFKEDGQNYLKVNWKSDQFSEVHLHRDYLYQSPKIAPLKLFEYQSEQIILFTLKNDENAFIDSPVHKLQDIPSQFVGLIQIRLQISPQYEEIRFISNGPIVLYIAANLHEPKPLSDEFIDTKEFLTVLKINKFAEVKRGKLRASQSFPFKIYQKKYMAGEVLVKLETSSGDEEDDAPKRFIQLIMWYQLDTAAAKPLSCGGIESEISKNDGDAFKECKVSSTLPGGQYNCDYAFSGQLIDQPFKIWASDGEGIGSWIEIAFKKEYQVTKIVYKNRENAGERNREIEIFFSSGSKKIVELKNSDSPQTIKFEPVVCRSIRFTVKTVYTANNNGGAFQIFGIPCKSNEPKKKKKADPDKPQKKKEDTDDGDEEDNKPPPPSMQEEEEDDTNKVMELQCKDAISNNEALIKRSFKPGDEMEAICIEKCASVKDVKVYGNQVYSEDSSLCKASEHLGVNVPNKKFKVIIERFRNLYEGGASNGIITESKMTNEGSISVTFQTVKDDTLVEMDKIFVGQKVDLYSEKKKIWVPGFIKELDRRNLYLLFLKVGYDGFDSSFDESVQFPNSEKMQYCGTKIKTREDCDEKSKDKKAEKKQMSIKICFSGNADCGLKGMDVDNGFIKKVQPNGFTYGWDRDISANTRTRGQMDAQLLDNLILFPPDEKSQWCNGELKGKIPCAPARWTIEVENGAYDVKVMVGDPLYSTGVSININDFPLIDSYILKKNQFYTKDTTILVTKGQITIDGICKSNKCNDVWSRITMVEISVHKETKGPSTNEQAQKLGCGNAYQGGTCSTGVTVENCVFPAITSDGIKNCAQIYKLVKIPKTYECKAQREQFKCIKIDFKNSNECGKNCPGKCKGNKCNVPPF